MILRVLTTMIGRGDGSSVRRRRRRVVVSLGLGAVMLAGCLPGTTSSGAQPKGGAGVKARTTTTTASTAPPLTAAPPVSAAPPVTAAPTPTVPPTVLPVTTGTTVWHADADRDSDAGSRTLFWKKESSTTSRLGIVDDPTGQFGKVYRAYLTPNDITSDANRAEFSQALLGDGDTKLRLANDVTPRGSTQNIWFGWRSLFGSDLVIADGHSNDGNYMQLKGDSSCGGPAIGMTVKYGRLTLRSERYLTEYRNIAWNGPKMSTLLGSWHSFVLHVQFSKDASIGYLEVWLDGSRQTMSNGQTRIYFPTVCPDDTYVYPKLGVYGMDVAVGAGPVHWIESPRIGTSYESAAPR
jgi:hypothetical protein